MTEISMRNPELDGGLLRRAGRGAWGLLFGTLGNTLITLCSAVILAMVLPKLYSWLIGNAIFHGTPDECRAAAGACWAFIGEKFRFILFGTYPADERWRGTLTIVVLLATLLICMVPRFWSGWLILFWAASIVVTFWLLLGGLGLPRVRTELIGGLPVTLLLGLTTLPLSFPLGLLLALGRQSELWLFRWISIVMIEIFRGAPLVAVLFMASVMVPFFTPEGFTPPKLTRAIVAFVLVSGAYTAEALRGGFQTIPAGQAEAAAALGLSRAQTLWNVTLPQVLRQSIPALVNIVVPFFKNTSLVVVIGMTDFLGAISLASRDPVWLGFSIEGYLFAALFYFCFCTLLSAYAARIERQNTHH